MDDDGVPLDADACESLTKSDSSVGLWPRNGMLLQRHREPSAFATAISLMREAPNMLCSHTLEVALMRSLTTIGVILIILGILGFIIPRITFTEETTAVEVGPLEVTTEQERSIPIPDIAAGVAVVAGIVMVVAGSGSRRA